MIVAFHPACNGRAWRRDPHWSHALGGYCARLAAELEPQVEQLPPHRDRTELHEIAPDPSAQLEPYPQKLPSDPEHPLLLSTKGPSTDSILNELQKNPNAPVTKAEREECQRAHIRCRRGYKASLRGVMGREMSKAVYTMQEYTQNRQNDISTISYHLTLVCHVSYPAQIFL